MLRHYINLPSNLQISLYCDFAYLCSQCDKELLFYLPQQSGCVVSFMTKKHSYISKHFLPLKYQWQPEKYSLGKSFFSIQLL